MIPLPRKALRFRGSAWCAVLFLGFCGSLPRASAQDRQDGGANALREHSAQGRHVPRKALLEGVAMDQRIFSALSQEPVPRPSALEQSRASPSLPGSRLRSQGEVASVRSRVLCLGQQGRWEYRGEPRPLPWSVTGTEKCDISWAQQNPRNLHNRAADRVTSPDEWHVREGLKYTWQVNSTQCGGTTMEPFKRSSFCSLMDELGGPILLVGDSITRNLFHALHNNLLMGDTEQQSRAFTPDVCKSWVAQGLPRKKGRPLCEALDICRYPIYRVRNDLLSLVEDSPKWEGIDFHLPWISLIQTWGIKAVLMNRGAHYRPTEEYAPQLDASLSALRQQHPDVLLLYRSTPPGHLKCEEHERPLELPQPTDGLPFHWDEFPAQNQIARALVERHGGLFLDVEYMTSMRPDSHPGFAGLFKHDCLHYCSPGPLDTWVQLLQAALKMVLGGVNTMQGQ